MEDIIKTNYNRRSFLKVSAAAGGGLMLGFNWLAGCVPAAREKAAVTVPDEWYDINAFLKIGNNGVVTIFSPNPEIGQNVKTAMPMIVAEELDVDWSQVVVEQAPLDVAKYRRQVAGGSQSIRQGWQSLRMAGATARRMLMEAAAQKWQVPVGELTTQPGNVMHEASGRQAGYGELADLAATLEVPAEVALKDPKDFSIIGHSTKNVDGPKIVRGEPLYGLDYHEEGMLTAMIIHPPAFGMRPGKVDDSAARNMPGIKDIFVIDTKPASAPDQWQKTFAFPQMVAIVGDSTWQVMQAKKAVRVEWERLSPGISTSDYRQDLNKLLNEAPAKPARLDGNPEQAFARAAKVVESTYSAPYLAHNTLEPMNFFARVTPDKAELIGPVQTPERLWKTAAEVLGMPLEKVSVQMTRQGGGFGRRLYGHFGVEAAVIAQRTGKPVKLIYTREDDMTYGTYRPAYKVKYRAALDANNKLIGFHVRGAGTHGSPVFANRFPAGAVDNYLAENHNLDSNISTGAWRAPRSNFIAGAEQAFLDEVAEAAGQDPVAFRLSLFERAINNPVGSDNDYDAQRYAGVIRLVAEKAGWGKETPGVYRGFAAYYCHNSYVAEVVDVVMKNDQPQ
ncbi:MAG TPA: xanthine dehydrogenase family protein molybdopterin-binding subunit, partial [Flammeovirgaceae bacterium]|nr:xanthine dehydrogenase family protein molybdopterin-binding subunit [Flammeovirgaceae bacterium]